MGVVALVSPQLLVCLSMRFVSSSACGKAKAEMPAKLGL